MTKPGCLMFGSEAFTVFFLVPNPVCAAKLKALLSKFVFFFSPGSAEYVWGAKTGLVVSKWGILEQ